MKEEIKKFRVEIDGIAQLVKELKPNKIYSSEGSYIINATNSKEIEKAVDSLYLAKAWLGKILEELGTENPYGSGYKTKEDIVPTQDVHKHMEFTNEAKNLEHPFFFGNAGTYHDYQAKNHIEKVDWLRNEIEASIHAIKRLSTKDLSREFAIARTNCYNHLCEAKFQLGFELARIKNNPNHF